MGKRIYLNEKWQFCENFETEMITMEYDDSSMQNVRIPHTCKELPYHYFDEEIYQMVSAYRRYIKVPADWMGKRVLLTFEGVAHACEIYVNGKKIGKTVTASSKNGYYKITIPRQKKGKKVTIKMSKPSFATKEKSVIVKN